MRNYTEKNKNSQGHGEKYRLLWEMLLDQKGRENERLALRDSIATRAGFPALSVVLGSGKSKALSPSDVALLQWRKGADMVGELILDLASSLAAREVVRLRWAGCGGATVAAGAQSANDARAGSIKHLDQADQVEFCAVFAAALAPFAARRPWGAFCRGVGPVLWSSVERVRAEKARALKEKREMMLSAGDADLLASVDLAIRRARTECRSWIYSRGGVEGDGIGRADLAVLDGSEGLGGERVLLRPSPSWSAFGGGKSAGVVFVPSSYWHGNASFPSLGWSRVSRAVDIDAECARIVSLSDSADDLSVHTGKARTKYGQLARELHAMSCGSGEYVSPFVGVSDSGEGGQKAREALRLRVHRWQKAIDSAAVRDWAREKAQRARIPADGWGLLPAPWIIERDQRLADDFRAVLSERFNRSHSALFAAAFRRDCARRESARAVVMAETERAAAAGLLRFVPAQVASPGRAFRRLFALLRRGLGAGLSACQWRASGAELVRLRPCLSGVALGRRCETFARLVELRALRASVVDLRASRSPVVAESARVRVVSLLQSLRALGGMAAALAARAVRGVSLVRRAIPEKIEAEQLEALRDSTALDLRAVQIARNSALLARPVARDNDASKARAAARAGVRALSVRALSVRAAVDCARRPLRAGGVLCMGARPLAGWHLSTVPAVPALKLSGRGVKRKEARREKALAKRKGRANVGAVGLVA